MGTDVYVVDSREMKPWYELLPNKIKKVLENPGPRDRLLVCVAEDICGADNGEREFLITLVALSIQARATLTRKTTTN